MKKEKSMLQIAKENKKGYSFVDDGKGAKLLRKNNKKKQLMNGGV